MFTFRNTDIFDALGEGGRWVGDDMLYKSTVYVNYISLLLGLNLCPKLLYMMFNLLQPGQASNGRTQEYPCCGNLPKFPVHSW